MIPIDRQTLAESSPAAPGSDPEQPDGPGELAVVAGAVSWLLFHTGRDRGDGCSLGEIARDPSRLRQPLSSFGVSSLRWMEILTVVEEELDVVVSEESMTEKLDQQMSLYELSSLLVSAIKERGTIDDRV